MGQSIVRREDSRGTMLTVLKALEIEKTLGVEPTLTALRHFTAFALSCRCGHSKRVQHDE